MTGVLCVIGVLCMLEHMHYVTGVLCDRCVIYVRAQVWYV